VCADGTDVAQISSQPPVHFVSMARAATVLGCGRSTLYQYVRSGDLHLVHHGRHSVLAVQEIDRLALRLATQAGVEPSLLRVTSWPP